MKSILKAFILFLIGGLLYYLIEILWRGYSSHFMVLIGGICFCLIGKINEFFTYEMSLLKQCLISTFLVTIIEFISGVILNIIFKLNIWDYSDLPFSVFGQISLLYSFYWFWISILAIFADDFIRWKLFKEEKPHYKII
jgi:uncharacterized membrane protein